MLDHSHIDTEHILLGLLHEGEGGAAKALESQAISLKEVRQQVEEIVGQGQQAPSGHIPFTKRTQKLLELTLKESLALGHKYISTEHILLGLIRQREGVAVQVLLKLGADLNQVREQVLQILASYQGKEPTESGSGRGKDTPLSSLPLDQFGRNLTAIAREGKLNPIIGREKEIERLMQVLSRRTKNNPVLIGEPGVGKTAVVEGLAQNMVKGEVPETLKNKQLYTLDLGSLAGSHYRADLEERLKKVLIHTRGDIILLIDEHHGFDDMGASEDRRNLINLLKTIVARQEIQVIYTATPSEYSNGVQNDPTLAQMVQPILISPPSVTWAIEILKGVRDRFEAHHRVAITDDALTAAVTLTNRYLGANSLPGKAIDLIDEAGARCQIRHSTAPPDLREFDEKIANVRREKESAIDGQDFERAAALRDREKRLLAQKSEREKQWKYEEVDDVREVDEHLISEVAADLFNDSRLAGVAGERIGTASLRAEDSPHPSNPFKDEGSMWSIC
jgi:ATP-dependent Clp protease ATP-binding subunit ClpC